MNLYLDRKGIRISTGTIVDATIIAAPSSTKNQKKERDPEMHQTKKGNQGSLQETDFKARLANSSPIESITYRIAERARS